MPALPLQELPIGIQDFDKLREKNCLYVDKTELLYQLITTGSSYFLSRPRRFGKSLMISTLEMIFKARKELFENTWILTDPKATNYDWKEYPVIRIDMGEISKKSEGNLEQALLKTVLNIASQYQIVLPEPLIDSASALSSLIQGLVTAKKTRVAVLIDEYDKPILDNILDEKKAEEIREVLRYFYTIFKSQDGNLQFLMLTGVTKFSKVSIFSGLNHPEDLTLSDAVSGLLGYTQAELEYTFMPWIERLATELGTSVEAQLEKIKLWYNGYRFSGKGIPVYNPFSVLLLLKQQRYKTHWFETGSPTFLMKLLKSETFKIERLNELIVSDEALNMSDISQIELVALLYQTGYLTIKSYDQEYRAYTLDYPNLEVKIAFSDTLLNTFSSVPSAESTDLFIDMNQALRAGNYMLFFEVLKSFIASIPYTQFVKMKERDFQTVLFLIFTLLGYRMSLEVHTSRRRLDAVLELPDGFCIFEYKVNQSAEVALAQIKEKQYFQPYLHRNKKIHLFGINFSSEERNINQWIHEEWKD